MVAIEPFATAREEVPHFGRVMVPGVGRLIPDKTYQKSLDEAGQMADYDPDEADAVKAIQRTPPPCSSCTARTIGSCRTGRASACTPPRRTTASWSRFPTGPRGALVRSRRPVAQRARDWFDRWLGGERETAQQGSEETATLRKPGARSTKSESRNPRKISRYGSTNA